MAKTYFSVICRHLPDLFIIFPIPNTLAICCFYFGFFYYNECPSEPIIPKSLVIFAVFILILDIIVLLSVRILCANYIFKIQILLLAR